MSCVKNLDYKITQGVSEQAFVSFLTLGNEQGETLMKRLFNTIDKNNDGHITWREFLSAMKILNFGSAGQKIDLLFEIYDTDGNGGLSYEEIKELCGLQLNFSHEDAIMGYLSESFASLIFDLAHVKYD